MARFAALFSLFALFALAVADIKFDDGDESTTVLASFGDASASVSILYKGPEAEPVVSRSPLFTVGAISSSESGEYTNYTIPFSFDKTVGSGTYTVTIGDDEISGSVIVAGFVILEDGVIVSGDDRDGVTVGQDGTTKYEVKAVGVDGRSVDISGTTISATEESGPYMKEVDMAKTSIDSDEFTLAISKFRVGTGKFVINFDTSAIEYRGESFETVLKCTQRTSPRPPCVAIGGEYDTTDDGYVKIPMYNLGVPPPGSAVETVTITIDSESVDWDKSKSSLDVPDQIAVFKISAGGEATITCDGDDAYVLGDDITVSGDTVLAKDTLIKDGPPADSNAIRATFRIIPGSPETTLRSEVLPMLAAYCATIKSKGICEVTDIRSGSTLVDMAGEVDEDNISDGQTDIQEAVKDCSYQKQTSFDCDEITLETVSGETKAVAGATAAAGGLATWTIVLIACVGALALVLVIVLGLWAVYRRSAERSESDYSSSGPLGVPDPSDLLYEQSIVRDIYGRGDFPDGGPSAAVAEQRAREADLREEYPRPPSSSGLSRGTGTDDASSTYSV